MTEERSVVRIGKNKWFIHRNENGYIDEVREVPDPLAALTAEDVKRARSARTEK